MASSTNDWRRLTHTDDPPILRSNALVRRVLEQPDLFAHTLLQISTDWRKLLLVVSTVSRSWAVAAEPALRAAAEAAGWRQPRRARLQGGGRHAPALPDCPWRHLLLKHACRACFAAPGDFAIRAGGAHAAPSFFLCGACCKAERTVQRLQRGRFTIDVTGLSGRPLYSRSKSKFCADVSKYATR